jgi:SAM-dependent methyltransferase
MTPVKTSDAFKRVERCRICGSTDLWTFLSLGETPLANSLVAPSDASAPEARFPLEVARCAECGLVQLTVVVDPEVMFRHYLYASSASSPLLPHFDAYAAEVVERFASAGSLVVEVGSNDGVLLRPLADRGARVLGIEPSTNIAAIANAAGLETWNDFFSAEVARRVVAEKGKAKAVLANNVLAHIDDLHDVVRGLGILLDQTGVFVAEFPYLLDLMEHVEYDTIYHEHLSYLAIGPLQRLFAPAGLEPFDVHHLDLHGGSLRLFVGRTGAHPISAELRRMIEAERSAGGLTIPSFERFSGRVRESKDALRDLLAGLRRDGRSVAALGATAKGNTLLNYCGIGPDDVAWVADSTPLKQGLLTPGMHIPVRPERAIRDDRPDYTLLLAWNYADAIVKRFADYLESGGHFIHPIPRARVIAA